MARSKPHRFSPSLLSVRAPHLSCSGQNLGVTFCPPSVTPHVGHPTPSPLAEQTNSTSKIHPESDCFSPPSLGTGGPRLRHPSPGGRLQPIVHVSCAHIACARQSHMTPPSHPTVRWGRLGNVLYSAKLRAHCTPRFLGKKERMNNGGDEGVTKEST